MIADALSFPDKVKSAGLTFTLSVLIVSVVVLFGMVFSLYQDDSDKRLAVVESKLVDIDKKLDKMDTKLDRLLER
jgi:hypothetical protein